ncbi:MAG: alpha/beta hydrolase [Sediminibacterium sp. Gen4]|jgi:pimeloyl-ACP methyl ester carboxylesterase|uniref:alpha/beta fold hydrolase n=1 Tax=unclassified Sediminibacterium TaxID=2635961 RepID=UPI0015BE01DA|nr:MULTISPECIES: alpha/beta hydrolase [unclassified Sediminibacterium]MBW0159991.1 alpha/beta hydrolase [Sediminibacterium sp.]MBW0165460.1 alpha/beta hydrolase [Sediminibacterium sp.]NWK65403.1 alpha/beta hydrolase [Sediminibacterium sp. Gen4]
MHKQCTWSDGTIHYQVVGTGIPVVLLHGFGEDSSIWNAPIAHLQKTCTLIIPDLPGTGLSEWKSAQHISLQQNAIHLRKESYGYSPPKGVLRTFTIDTLADAVHSMLVNEKIDQCFMLGHSMGGYITLAYAEKYKEQLLGLGLIHSTSFADSEEKKNNRLRGIEMMDKYGGFAFLKNTIPNLFGTSFKKNHPEIIEALIEKSASIPTSSLQAYYSAMMQRPDRTAVLRGNPLPVLFVLGTEDVAAPLNDVLQQTHLPLNSYIHILDGIGHMGMLESTERIHQYIDAFIHQS